MANDRRATYEKGESLALRHAFFTRENGFSANKDYSGLNVTTRVGDDKNNVLANRALALRELNFKTNQLAYLDELAHESRVLDATGAAGGMDFNGYDIIMTADPTVVIGLSVADCLPVILASEEQGVVAIAHAGWRGLKDQVVAKAVEAMAEVHGAKVENIKAIIGPGISLENFEFGDDAVEIFDERYIKMFGSKPHIDLSLMAEDQLAEIGVRQIENLKIDTFEDRRFYSVRHDGSTTGRHLVVVSL